MEKGFTRVVRSLIHFGCGCFQVVKVNQLGAINKHLRERLEDLSYMLFLSQC